MQVTDPPTNQSPSTGAEAQGLRNRDSSGTGEDRLQVLNLGQSFSEEQGHSGPGLTAQVEAVTWAGVLNH